MRRDISISFVSVTKVYKLYPDPLSMTLDVLGVSKLLFWKQQRYQEFAALKDINLEVMRGQRIGIVGRNGAGKTTLLKLITGNFQPTAGHVAVNGQVQALMDMGLGFHQELNGLDNIKASLIYNGLAAGDVEEATADIVEFAELGDYLFQPLKTYSLGMQARLGFATATAIKPDILIIDEVLGAGDGYFAAKSAERMKKLTSDGVTLLLVSHSTPQIIQFCETAVWIDQGKIVEQGDALEVVKAYDAYLRSLDERRLQAENKKREDKRVKQTAGNGRALTQSRAAQQAEQRSLSRWPGQHGIKIKGVELIDERGKPAWVAEAGSELIFRIRFYAEETAEYECRFVVLLYTLDGRPLSLHCSDTQRFTLGKGEDRCITLHYDNLMLGNGEYVFSVAAYRKLDMHDTSTAEVFDLLDRSYQFKVFSKYPLDPSVFYHPARWSP